MFTPLPFVSDEVLHKLNERAERTADGCLLLRPRNTNSNPNRIRVEGRYVTITRLVYAESEGDAGLDTHEVIHIPECPHTENKGQPICIEPSHLMLGDVPERMKVHRTRLQGAQP